MVSIDIGDALLWTVAIILAITALVVTVGSIIVGVLSVKVTLRAMQVATEIANYVKNANERIEDSKRASKEAVEEAATVKRLVEEGTKTTLEAKKMIDRMEVLREIIVGRLK